MKIIITDIVSHVASQYMNGNNQELNNLIDKTFIK